MSMNYKLEISTKIDGVYEISPDAFSDLRGDIWTSFHPSYLSGIFDNYLTFHHDKFVKNKRDVLRGLHGDSKTYKLVSCPIGDVLQVALDVRKSSGTFGEFHMTSLTEDNRKMMLLPPGVANGFLVNSELALYHYKLAYYGEYTDSEDQFTVKFDDPRFKIPWPERNFILSDRDR